jgi:signal peptidase
MRRDLASPGPALNADLGQAEARAVWHPRKVSRAIAGHRLLDLLFATAIGLMVFVLLIGRVVPLTGRQTLVIASGSMSPTIPVGAAVILDQADPASLVNGDVVALRVGSNGAVVTHRISRVIRRDDQVWLETKGDANPSVDPAMTPTSALIGRVKLIIPFAGYLLKFLSVPTGIVSLFCLIALLLMVNGLLPMSPTNPSRQTIVSQVSGRSGLRGSRS